MGVRILARTRWTGSPRSRGLDYAWDWMIRLARSRSVKTVNGCYDNCFRARHEKHNMNDSVFTHTQDQLKALAQSVLSFAKEQGATDASVEISEGSGLSVSVRRGQI